jgi:quercetin dioxygenase-like cupin family protein
MLQSRNGQVLFLETDQEVQLPLHTHGDQWGFVVSGAMELTIGGRTRTFTRGDSYFIPAGTPHGGKLQAGFRAMDYFADPERYKPRGNSS